MTRLLEFVQASIKAMPEVIPHLTGRARWYARVYTYKDDGQAVKTYEGYYRQLWGRTQELYSGEITEGEFIDALANLIQEQITRAWRAALRDSEVDPDLVNTTYADAVETTILNEYDHVDAFARAIREAALASSGVEQFQSRCEMWANRYNDAYNMALLEIRANDETTTGKAQNMQWQRGATEKSCDICITLDGVIAPASVWKDAGIFPQSGEDGALPNPALISHRDGQDGCGGWKCDCSLKDTDESATIESAQDLRDLIGW